MANNFRAEDQLPPLVPPECDEPQFTPWMNNTVSYLLRVLFDLIDRRGVPRSQTCPAYSNTAAGPHMLTMNHGLEAPLPTTGEVNAAEILMSKRTPMIIAVLLRNIWPGGMSSTHSPDPFILSKLWTMIREYDINSRILSYHVDYAHEAPDCVHHIHRYTSHQCSCWSNRLGEGWATRTIDEEMTNLLPPGMQRRPPDRLKRMLTATLDDYIKENPSLTVRNSWINMRKQPFVWARWAKPFVRSFLRLKGMHERSQGQFWYLLDADAKLLGSLLGYSLEHIQAGMAKWRQQELVIGPAPVIDPAPVVPAPQSPPPRDPDERLLYQRQPNEVCMFDEFMLNEYMRHANKTPITIPESSRKQFFDTTVHMNQFHQKKKVDQMNVWYSNNQGNKRARGNILMDISTAQYNERAANGNAPLLQTCWMNPGQLNEQWVSESIAVALVESNRWMLQVMERQEKTRATYRRNLQAHNQKYGILDEAEQTVQNAMADLMHEANANDNPILEDVTLPKGEPITLEEIYLVATAVTETSGAQFLPGIVTNLLLQQLRTPVVRERIRTNIRLSYYNPPVTSEDDMALDLWPFELGPANPVGNFWGAGGNWGGGGGRGGGGGGGNIPPGNPAQGGRGTGRGVNQQPEFNYFTQYTPITGIGLTCEQFTFLRQNSPPHHWLLGFAAGFPVATRGGPPVVGTPLLALMPAATHAPAPTAPHAPAPAANQDEGPVKVSNDRTAGHKSPGQQAGPSHSAAGSANSEGGPMAKKSKKNPGP